MSPHHAESSTCNQRTDKSSNISHNVKTPSAERCSDSSDDTEDADRELVAQVADQIITSTSPQRTCKSQTHTPAETSIWSQSLSQEENSSSPSPQEVPSSRCHGLSENQSQPVEMSNCNGLGNVSSITQKLAVEDEEGISPYDRVIFIDSTWNQFGAIIRDERLAG